MDINPQTFFNLLSSYPGNLVYYLILIYSIVTCLLSIWTAYRSDEQIRPLYTLAGLTILLTASLIPLFFIVISGGRIAGNGFFYPLLERTSITFLVVWSAWLWFGPRPTGTTTIIAVFLSVLIPIITVIVSFIFPETTGGFNATIADFWWHIFMVLATLFLIILIFVKKPSIWSYGLGMFLLILIGFVVSLLAYYPEGDISGAARLGVICAFPLLPLVIRKFDFQEEFAPAGSFEQVMTTTVSHMIPEEINEWLAAVANLDVTHQQEAIARMLCLTLDAQGCAFLHLSETPNLIKVTSGYNLTKQSWIEETRLPVEEFPKTLTGLVNTEPVIIRLSNENTQEMEYYSGYFGMEDITSVALLPVKNGETQWGSAALFRTASEPSFQMESLLQYTKTAATLSHIFRNNETAIRERQELIRLAQQMDDLQAENLNLQSNLETLRLSAVQPVPEQATLQMLTLQQASETEIDRLRSENKLLLQTLAEKQKEPVLKPAIDEARISEELSVARAEIARLQGLLRDTRQRLKEMQVNSNISGTYIDGLRNVNNLITEIRHPLSTITAYVDLIISGSQESEKKEIGDISIDTLHSCLARLRSLMNDMADMNVLSSGVIDLEPEAMDLANAIDQAVETISASFMEKEISLKLDLPPILPFIFTYHEALKKVIIYLLQNAGKVTPRSSSVELRVEVHEESAEPYLMLEVTDHGGGVAVEDIHRVFSTLEVEQGKVIPGVGEVNGGLVASKTLIEAHGGRIWVDSEPGISTTYSVLLPIQKDKI